jgi:hypothetical protein
MKRHLAVSVLLAALSFPVVGCGNEATNKAEKNGEKAESGVASDDEGSASADNQADGTRADNPAKPGSSDGDGDAQDQADGVSGLALTAEEEAAIDAGLEEVADGASAESDDSDVAISAMARFQGPNATASGDWTISRKCIDQGEDVLIQWSREANRSGQVTGDAGTAERSVEKSYKRDTLWSLDGQDLGCNGEIPAFLRPFRIDALDGLSRVTTFERTVERSASAVDAEGVAKDRAAVFHAQGRREFNLDVERTESELKITHTVTLDVARSLKYKRVDGGEGEIKTSVQTLQEYPLVIVRHRQLDQLFANEIEIPRGAVRALLRSGDTLELRFEDVSISRSQGQCDSAGIVLATLTHPGETNPFKSLTIDLDADQSVRTLADGTQSTRAHRFCK